MSLKNTPKQPDQLRSARWFEPDDLRSFGHRSRAMQLGYAPQDWAGKPVIAINTATYWHALRACGIPDKRSGFGSLLEHH